MKPDIQRLEDIRILVDQFYRRARKDALLGSIFLQVADADGQKDALYQYWCGVLLNDRSEGQPFPPHIERMLNRRHFVRWMNLFLETIDDLYAGERAAAAKVTVIRKSEEFQSRLALIRF